MTFWSKNIWRRHGRWGKLFFFWIPIGRQTICCHLQENWSNFIVLSLYNMNTNLWPLNSLNVKTTGRIWKTNYIFWIPEPRWMIWHTLSNIQALLIFDPLITLWVILKPLISKCPKMPKWHQLVPMSGHVQGCQFSGNCLNSGNLIDFPAISGN